MNIATILARVNEVIDLVHELTPAHDALKALAGDLEAQVRAEIANSKGVGNATKTVVKLLDGAKNDHRDALAYPWIDGQGRQCVCNGFLAFMLRNHLPLPERPENIGDPIDLDRLFPDSLKGWKKLPMPSAKELREFIAIERAKFTGKRQNFGPLWDFGPHAPSVNALYLLDAVTVFPNAAEIFWISVFRTLVISCEDGDGLLLPVRVEGKTDAPAGDAEREALEALKAQEARNNEEAAKRREIISKSHDDYSEAAQHEAEAAKAAYEALKAAEKAPDEAAKAAAMERYYNAAESVANYRVRKLVARQIFDPQHSITPEEFENIVKLRYAREYTEHNAA